MKEIAISKMLVCFLSRLTRKETVSFHNETKEMFSLAVSIQTLDKVHLVSFRQNTVFL